jgi:hypothetical protein
MGSSPASLVSARHKINPEPLFTTRFGAAGADFALDASEHRAGGSTKGVSTHSEVDDSPVAG